jgi:hypothetical protein
MNKRTRLFLVAAVGVLVLGLGTGLVASYVGLQNFSIIGGNGPDELSYVPAEARMIAYADVRSVVTSELRQKLQQFEPNADQKHEFETQTGIDIERDIDSVLAAAWPGAAGIQQGPPLVLARGRFDKVRIEGLIREHGGAVEDYKGERPVGAKPEGPGSALAVPVIQPGGLPGGVEANVRYQQSAGRGFGGWKREPEEG